MNNPSQATDNLTKPIIMYFDDACVICRTEAHNMQSRNPNGIQLMSVDEGIEELNAAGFSRVDAMTYLCVKDSDGGWHTHMDAVRLLYKTGGVAWANALYLPIVKQLGDFAYPFIARNRYRIPNWVTKTIYRDTVAEACQDGACRINPAKR